MKSISFTILLFVLVIVANGINGELLIDAKQDALQDIQEPMDESLTDESFDDSMTSRNNEDTSNEEDSVMKVR